MQPLAVTVRLGVRVSAERVGPVRWIGVTNRITAHGCVSTKWAIPVHTGGINGVRKQPCSPSITSDQDPFVS